MIYPDEYLIDSHCHLGSINLESFDNDLSKLIELAVSSGVKEFLNVCLTLDDVPFLKACSAKYPQVFYSVGVHPTENLEEHISVELLLKNSEDKACIAVGETGLDYYHIQEKSLQKIQHKRFVAHIEAALAIKKPLIIHTRNAAADTLGLMKANNARDIGGVMHCFSENWDFATKAMDLNFYISFSGVVTFKNATALQEVAKLVPLDRILVETDAPYLAPVPFRGKQNHPALVKETAMFLANLRKIDYNTFAKATTDNFNRCFLRV